MSDSGAADLELDASGLKCPLPVLKARKAMKGLEAGQTLLVRATDPSALEDFPAFCRTTGHELLESGEGEAGHYLFLLRKTG